MTASAVPARCQLSDCVPPKNHVAEILCPCSILEIQEEGRIVYEVGKLDSWSGEGALILSLENKHAQHSPGPALHIQ